MLSLFKRKSDSIEKTAPNIEHPKKDLFNGNIYNPGEFIFIYGLMYVALIAFLIFTVCNMIKDDESISAEAVFYDCIESDDDIVLLSNDGLKYVITEVPEGYDPGPLKHICDGRTTVNVQIKAYKDDRDEQYFSVREIIEGDSELLSAESTAEIRHKYYIYVGLFPVGFLLLWTAVVAASIVTGRNPQKHPKLVKLLFDRSYIKYPLRTARRKKSKKH